MVRNANFVTTVEDEERTKGEERRATATVRNMVRNSYAGYEEARKSRGIWRVLSACVVVKDNKRHRALRMCSSHCLVSER